MNGIYAFLILSVEKFMHVSKRLLDAIDQV